MHKTPESKTCSYIMTFAQPKANAGDEIHAAASKDTEALLHFPANSSGHRIVQGFCARRCGGFSVGEKALVEPRTRPWKWVHSSIFMSIKLAHGWVSKTE